MPMPEAEREERLAQVTAELEALEARMHEYEDARARLERNRHGRLVVQHVGLRDSAREFAGQLEMRVENAEPGSEEQARWRSALVKQNTILGCEAEAVKQALRAGGFASEEEARAARLSTDDIKALEHEVDLFAERYNATLRRYLDLGGTLEEE